MEDRESGGGVESQGDAVRGDIRIQDGISGSDVVVGHGAKLVKLPPSEPPTGDALFRVPFERSRDFVGRETDLKRLHQALQEEKPVGITGLTGMGGIGKTQLAVEYAYKHRAEYPGGVFWINAAEPLETGFAELGRYLQPDTVERSLEAQMQAAESYLRSHPDSLLILDNVLDPAELRLPVRGGLVPAALPCRRVFTTRRRDTRGFDEVEIRVLDEPAAMRLLLGDNGRSGAIEESHPEHRAARSICYQLGRLPLALKVAASYLSKFPEITLDGFQERLEAEGMVTTLDEEFGDLELVHELAVGFVLRSQWDALEDESAKHLLRVAGQMPEAALIPIARLGLLAGVSRVASPGRPSELQRALKRLTAASLVEELLQDQVQLHPLVREFVAAQIHKGERAEFRAACAVNLAEAYRDFETLERHCAARGVAALEEDIRMALALLSGFAERNEAARRQTEPFLLNLLRLLREESHTLRHWDSVRAPAYFAQQSLKRAVMTDADDLREVIEERMARLTAAHLKLRWCTVRHAAGPERTLEGHGESVWTVAVTADGRRAVSGSADGTLKVWDLKTGVEVLTLEGHRGPVASVSVMADGRRAVSGSSDGTLKLWDLETGAEVWATERFARTVEAVAVTSDGRRAVSGSSEGTIEVWDLDTGAEVRTLEGHTDAVESVAVTSDGQRVVSGSADATLRVWDLKTGTEVRTLEGHAETVRSVAVTADGQRAVSGSNDRTLKVWDLNTGQAIRTLEGHTDTVESVAVASDGRRAISGSADRTLKVWDLDTGVEVRTLEGHTDWVGSVAATADWRRAVSSSNDGTLMVWDLETTAEMHALKGHAGPVESVVVTSDGRRAVSGSVDRTLKVWDLKTGEQVRTLEGHSDAVLSVAVTSDGRRAVSGSYGGALKLWDLETGAEVRTLEGHDYWVMSVALTSDGRRAVSGSIDRTLKVWELETGAELRTLKGHSGWVWSVALTSDGRRAVSGSADGTLKLWDLDTGAVVRTLEGHTETVKSVAVTADGRRAVSGSWDGTLKVWDLDTGAEVQTLEGHRDWVWSVAVTADGRRAVSGSTDGTFKVWDLEKRTAIASMKLDDTGECVDIFERPGPQNRLAIFAGGSLGNVYCLDLMP